MDYEVQRFTRHCATTGRELAPGEEFYTALVAEGAEVRRLDFAARSMARSARPDTWGGGSRACRHPMLGGRGWPRMKRCWKCSWI